MATKQQGKADQDAQDYPWIVAWGKMLASRPYYVREQCAEARARKAPREAYCKVFQSDEWSTIDQLPPDTLTRLRGYLPEGVEA